MNKTAPAVGGKERVTRIDELARELKLEKDRHVGVEREYSKVVDTLKREIARLNLELEEQKGAHTLALASQETRHQQIADTYQRQVESLESLLADSRCEADNLRRQLAEGNALLTRELRAHEADIVKADSTQVAMFATIEKLADQIVDLNTIRTKVEFPEVGPAELDDCVVLNTGSVVKKTHSFRAVLSRDSSPLGITTSDDICIDLPTELVELLARKKREVSRAFVTAPGEYPIVIHSPDGGRVERNATEIMMGFANSRKLNRPHLIMHLAFPTISKSEIDIDLEELAEAVEAEFREEKSAAPPSGNGTGDGAPYKHTPGQQHEADGAIPQHA